MCFTRVTIDACGKLLGWENDTSQRGDARSYLRQIRVIWRQTFGEAVCTYHKRECERRPQTLRTKHCEREWGGFLAEKGVREGACV